MDNLSNRLKVLKFIDENGPINFKKLVNSEELDLSRNTINKYLGILREENLIEKEHEDRKVFNSITSEGKLELEKYLGKNDLTHRLNAYMLYEKKIQEFRDGFVERFGPINDNNLFLDCIENFLNFKQYKFDEQLPSEDFCYYLAYFISRFDLQYCKSQTWLGYKSEIIKLTQSEFFKKYKIDPIEIKYFCKEWKKYRPIFLLNDENENLWLLSSTSYLFESLMWQITIRAKRGLLQEIVFENFTFSLSNEATKIAYESIQAHRLELDFAQNRLLIHFINGMLNHFLEQHKGYRSSSLYLPEDRESLLQLSTDLEVEFNNENVSEERKLEILRMLMKINEKIMDYSEAILWGEKLLEIDHDDVDTLTTIALLYYHTKQYEKFLKCKNRLRREIRYDMILMPFIIEYFIEIKGDLKKALEEIYDAEEFLLKNDYSPNLYPKILYYKAKIYKKKELLKDAKLAAEKAWKSFKYTDYDLFELICEIYGRLEQWERLEDFCREVYEKDPYEPRVLKPLYYSLLKRNSNIKANELHERVRDFFPEYLEELDHIRNQFTK